MFVLSMRMRQLQAACCGRQPAAHLAQVAGSSWRAVGHPGRTFENTRAGSARHGHRMNRTTDRMPPQISIHLKALSIAACESLPSSVMPAYWWEDLSAEGSTASGGKTGHAGMSQREGAKTSATCTCQAAGQAAEQFWIQQTAM